MDTAQKFQDDYGSAYHIPGQGSLGADSKLGSGVDIYVANQWEWGASQAVFNVSYKYARLGTSTSLGREDTRHIQNNQSIEVES